MAAEVDLQSLVWALGILSVPVLTAIPLRFMWQYWIGGSHEESEYRTNVRQIIDSGRQLESYRHSLNDVARSLRITPSRQRLIEADILNPLSISHFLILPALIIFPLAFIVALPVMLVGLPVILLVEFVLIRQRVLIRIMSLVERTMHWQIIHIPQAHRGNPAQERNYTEFSQHIEHFHRVPRGVFLGLFAYLIVHWIFKLDNFGTEIILSSLLYIALLALVGVLSTAFETDLVFVDPSKGRLIPIDQWVESLLKPLVGVGLIFLLGRDLLEEARGGNAAFFAATFLAILYGAAIVGIAYQWGYSIWRGRRVQRSFEQQVIEALDPLSYDLTRSKGRIEFIVRKPMAERLQEIEEIHTGQLTFEDLESMPRSAPKEAPQNPL